MIRLRLYSLFVSLPVLIVIAGLLDWWLIEPGNAPLWNPGTAIAAVGLILHSIFVGAIGCPGCGKSPWMFADSAVFGNPWADAQCSRCGFDLREGRPAGDKGG